MTDKEYCPICFSTDIAVNHDGDDEEHECLACGEIWHEEKDLVFSEYEEVEDDDIPF